MGTLLPPFSHDEICTFEAIYKGDVFTSVEGTVSSKVVWPLSHQLYCSVLHGESFTHELSEPSDKDGILKLHFIGNQ